MFPGAYQQRAVMQQRKVQHNKHPVIPNKFDNPATASFTLSMAPADSTQSTAPSRSKAKRGTQPSKKQVKSMPTKKISRSIIGDDVKMHFEALSRRIVELEDEKSQLTQHITVLKQQTDAKIEKKNKKIKRKNQKIQHLKEKVAPLRCGNCQEPIIMPVFCDS